MTGLMKAGGGAGLVKAGGLTSDRTGEGSGGALYFLGSIVIK